MSICPAVSTQTLIPHSFPRIFRPRFPRPAERAQSPSTLSRTSQESGVGRQCAILVSVAADSQLTSHPVTTALSQSTVTVDSISRPALITLPTPSTLMAAPQYRQPD